MPSLSELEGQAADGRMTVVRWGLLTTEHVSNWYDGTARRSDDAPAAGYLDLLLRVNAEESHHGISACNSLRGCKTHSAAWSAAGCPEPSDAFASLQRRQSGNIPATHLRPWSAQSDALAPCLVVGPATLRSRGPRSRSCLVARSNRPHHQPSHRRGWTVPSPPFAPCGSGTASLHWRSSK
jgi:hypothetical protein